MLKWCHIIAVCGCLLAFVAPATAVPVTGGTGPGGIGLTNGSSSLKLWLKSDTIAQADSTPVASWTDSSGAGNHVTSTGTAQPLYKTSLINTRPGVQFDGVNDVLQTAADPTSLQITTGSVFVVGHMRTTSGFQGAVTYHRNYNVGTQGYWFGARSNGVAWLNADSTSVPNYQEQFGLGSWPANGSRIVDYRFDGANVVTRLGGAQVGTIAQTRTPTYAVGDRLLIGKMDNLNASFSQLDISEAIVFNQSLSSAQTTVLENNLNAKYDLSIANDVYAGDTPGLGNYDRDVFGIGRDASSAFTNSGAAGFGIEETGGSLTSGEWVLAGHKVVTNSVVGDRWNRVWYVDKTSVDGISAALSFDFTDAGLLAPLTGTSFNLLYSATDPFAFSALAVTSSVSGDTVTFAVPNALLLDGYYTLQFSLPAPEPSSVTLLMLGLVGLAAKRRRRARE
jgi:hypothetical protein